MKKIRIGVVGAGRGTSMINYSEYSGMSELVAICDKNEEILEVQKKALNVPRTKDRILPIASRY